MFAPGGRKEERVRNYRLESLKCATAAEIEEEETDTISVEMERRAGPFNQEIDSDLEIGR